MEDSFSSLSDIIKNKAKPKAPAYPWQDLALRIIAELGIPGFKKSSVFKICKEKTAAQVMAAMNDTKELCRDGAKWKYFFKVIEGKEKKYGERIADNNKS